MTSGCSAGRRTIRGRFAYIDNRGERDHRFPQAHMTSSGCRPPAKITSSAVIHTSASWTRSSSTRSVATSRSRWRTTPRTARACTAEPVLEPDQIARRCRGPLREGGYAHSPQGSPLPRDRLWRYLVFNTRTAKVVRHRRHRARRASSSRRTTGSSSPEATTCRAATPRPSTARCSRWSCFVACLPRTAKTCSTSSHRP